MNNRYLAILAILTLLILATMSVRASGYGSFTQISGASLLHGVCGDEAKGWLLVVGRGTNNYGVVYNITDLDSSPTSPLLSIDPGIFGPQYNIMTIYACVITQHNSNVYLLWLAGAITTRGGQQSKGVVLVYSIPSTGEMLTPLGNASTAQDIDQLLSIRDFIVVRNSSNLNTYHVYALSVLGTSVNLVRINATINIGGNPPVSFSDFVMDTIGSGDGYGITYSPFYNRFGVLWKSGNNLSLRVYQGVDTGMPMGITQIDISTSFTGNRAAEAAYSEGCLIAAEGKIYKVSASDLSVSTLIDNAFSGDAYAMLISEREGRSAAYMYAVFDDAISIYAYDLSRPSPAYNDTVTSGVSMSGFGDAFITWANPVDKKVNPQGSGNPYMVYTAGNGVIYYDLTRGGSIPYPIPEPGVLITLVVVVSLLVSVKHIRDRILPD